MEIERDYAYSVLEMNKRRFDDEKQTIENSYKYVNLFHLYVFPFTDFDHLRLKAWYI